MYGLCPSYKHLKEVTGGAYVKKGQRKAKPSGCCLSFLPGHRILCPPLPETHLPKTPLHPTFPCSTTSHGSLFSSVAFKPLHPLFLLCWSLIPNSPYWALGTGDSHTGKHQLPGEKGGMLTASSNMAASAPVG